MYSFTHIPLKTLQTNTQIPNHALSQLQTLYTFSQNFSPEFLSNQKLDSFLAI